MQITAIIQARMTSQRYPGKMLAPFQGKPLLSHVVERIRACNVKMPIVLATSEDIADDPLALYGNQLGVSVERGPRDDVMGRFVRVLGKHACEAFFRVCGDSPLLIPDLFEKAVDLYIGGSYDLVTNVFPRTFPAGMSVELLGTKTFLGMEKDVVEREDREHLTRYYYRNPEKFKIHNIKCDNSFDPGLRLTVDEIQDLKRLEILYISGDCR